MNDTPAANVAALKAVEEAITGTRVFAASARVPDEVRSTFETMLNDRGKVHGDFGDNAVYAQDLKKVLHESHNWRGMTPIQTEALEMIVHKIARILAGNPNHKDHWADIQGYARGSSRRGSSNPERGKRTARV